MEKIFYKILIIIAIIAAIIILSTTISLAAETVVPISLGDNALTAKNKICVQNYIKHSEITAQGMTEVKIKGKVYTVIAALVDADPVDSNSEPKPKLKDETSSFYYTHTIDTKNNVDDKENTLIIILENNKVVAIVNDYKFGHANSMTSDNKYIYIVGERITVPVRR